MPAKSRPASGRKQARVGHGTARTDKILSPAALAPIRAEIKEIQAGLENQRGYWAGREREARRRIKALEKAQHDLQFAQVVRLGFYSPKSYHLTSFDYGRLTKSQQATVRARSRLAEDLMREANFGLIPPQFTPADIRALRAQAGETGAIVTKRAVFIPQAPGDKRLSGPGKVVRNKAADSFVVQHRRRLPDGDVRTENQFLRGSTYLATKGRELDRAMARINQDKQEVRFIAREKGVSRATFKSLQAAMRKISQYAKGNKARTARILDTVTFVTVRKSDAKPVREINARSGKSKRATAKTARIIREVDEAREAKKRADNLAKKRANRKAASAQAQRGPSKLRKKR